MTSLATVIISGGAFASRRDVTTNLYSGCPRLTCTRLNMISAVCKSCSGCLSSWSSTGSRQVRRLQLDKPMLHPGDLSSVSEFLWHKVELWNLTMVFTTRFTNCFGGKDMTNIFRGQNSMRKSTEIITSLIQCFKHWPRRRVDRNTAIDRQMCLRLHQTLHAQINSCSSEGIQRCTQKFRNHRVGCTLNNNIRIFQRTFDFETNKLHE